MPDIKIYRELAKGDKQIFEDMVMSPYIYTINFFNAIHDFIERGELSDIEIGKEFYDLINPAINIDINQTLRLVELEEDLINLVANTDNKIFHRPLFFPTVFINNNIEYDGAIIKGILISEAIVREEEKPQLLYGDLYKDYGDSANDYVILSLMIDTKNVDHKEGNLLMVNLTEEEKIETGLTDQRIREININNFIKNMVVNTVDMVEGIDKDLSVTVIETTKERNLKRIHRGQLPFPTKIYIRAQGEFKKYVQRFNTDFQEIEDAIKRRKVLYKFMVRGHWRHFRAERYKAETKAKPKWIKPFWKGEGIPIAKEYKLVH